MPQNVISAPHPFDQISETDLRTSGSLKWTYFPDSIGAFVAEMDFGIAPPISTAITDALHAGLTGYLPTHTAASLQRATADWHAKHYGWQISPERVQHVPDVIAAFEWAINHFTTSDGAVIVPTPAYMPFLDAPVSKGRRVIQIASVERNGRMQIDLDALDAAFRAGGQMLTLCNPHNPLGTVYTAKEMEEISRVVDAHGGRVFSDEIHAPLVYSPARHIPYASLSDVTARHTLTATSASKSWNLAGLKCAQLIISNESDATLWQEHGGWVSHGTSTIGAIASIAAYTEGESWLHDVVGYLDGNRQRLSELVHQLLPRATVTYAEGTYIALIDFRAYGLTGDIGEWFRTHARVAMTDGSSCGDAGAGHARFIFALPRPLLEEAVRRIATALESQGTR